MNRIAKIYSDDFSTLFSYATGRVEITERYDGEDYIYSATLNGQGYITTLTDIDGSISIYSWMELENYLSPFMDAWESNAQDQLQG